jgi:hypothetical protein
MWGYEGEELEDIEATVKHVSTSKPDVFFTTVSYPIKGTPYYRRISERLVQVEPWGQSSDRDLKVRGRHTKQFYVHADKLLRDEVALARLADGPSLDNTELVSELRQSIQSSRAGLVATYSEVEV